ncbi:MAG: murein L,D-transpeptidase YafK [Flavobacteriales bacterium]|jgi:murein L,D-transpeptidase YafK
MRVFALFLGVVIHLGLYPSVLNKDLKVDKIEVFKSKRKLILYFEGKKVKQYSVSLGENPIGAK